MVGTGFSFDDGEQILVSVQKPFGIVLEQDVDNRMIIVAEVDPFGAAGRAGVWEGDVLVAVQNASIENKDLDDVMEFIQSGPRVMNLRFKRR
jgi:C-terminal processing protease CtpA/Prc